MARGKPGADSNNTVIAKDRHGKTLLEVATELFGETPVFWGRYFKGPGNTDPVQYQPAQENKVLHDNNIKLLPFARQTGNVGGSEEQGRRDGTRNTDALFAAIDKDYMATQGNSFYMFLDIEPNTPVSVSYYTGWAKAVISRSREISGNAVTILPCAYLNQRDEQTCDALTAAVNRQGAECHGAAIARYLKKDPPGTCRALVDWNDSLVRPEVPLPCEILIWQYVGDCYETEWLDANQVNPAIDLQADLLDKLILPPGQ